ncbi:hypothetical protein DAI22_01g029400 [Oryza sativa Japonica Group]|nr:hypothetical protein DAI22_01g029400 [Oryza sativa Japonica Group]
MYMEFPWNILLLVWRHLIQIALSRVEAGRNTSVRDKMKVCRSKRTGSSE